jgi:hypothetical protein
MDAVNDWVQRAAQAVSGFYGRYPVKQVSIFVLPARHGGIDGGEEWDGERIEIHLGPDTTIAELKDSWMLTHEMFHLSQPDFDDQYQWMSEGMADYLEPVARVRIGQITAQRFWKDLVEGLPQGLPEAGDGGLDRTHTWGRTYWGGCLFWLLADIQIREQTHNQKVDPRCGQNSARRRWKRLPTLGVRRLSRNGRSRHRNQRLQNSPRTARHTSHSASICRPLEVAGCDLRKWAGHI